MVAVTKRSTMAFFSDGRDHYSHRVRIVLAEKGVTVDIVDVDIDNKPDELVEHNPYNSLPTLLDRELTLYESKIMMEYLDERFPHPPLLPVYPVARAENRQYLYRIEKDWSRLVDLIESSDVKKTVDASRKELRESLMSVAPIFAEKPFFMSDELTLIDCALAAILWRLPTLGVEIPHTRQTKPLYEYMERLFTREAFTESLSEIEQDMQSPLAAS